VNAHIRRQLPEPHDSVCQAVGQVASRSPLQDAWNTITSTQTRDWRGKS